MLSKSLTIDYQKQCRQGKTLPALLHLKAITKTYRLNRYHISGLPASIFKKFIFIMAFIIATLANNTCLAQDRCYANLHQVMKCCMQHEDGSYGYEHL
jgi:hypothetical protein